MDGLDLAFWADFFTCLTVLLCLLHLTISAVLYADYAKKTKSAITLNGFWKFYVNSMLEPEDND